MIFLALRRALALPGGRRRRQARAAALRLARRLLRHRLPADRAGRGRATRATASPTSVPELAAAPRLPLQARQLRLRRGDDHVAARAHDAVRAASAPAASATPAATQIAAAERFLREHRGKVGLITVSIGGNDVTACARGASTRSPASAPPSQPIKQNVTRIAERLRKAAGQEGRIVGITYPDVILGEWVGADAEPGPRAALGRRVPRAHQPGAEDGLRGGRRQVRRRHGGHRRLRLARASSTTLPSRTAPSRCPSRRSASSPTTASTATSTRARRLHADRRPDRQDPAAPMSADVYELPEEHEDFRATIRQLARERIAPRAAEIDATDEYPWDIRRLLAEQDVLALPFAEEHGGTGTGTLMLQVAVEELAQASAAVALILMVQELGTLPIQRFGSPELQGAVPAALRDRRVVARVLPVRARRRLGPGGDAHERRARRRRVGDQRDEELDHQRRRRRLLRRVRRHRPRGAALHGVRRREGPRGLLGAEVRAQARHPRLADRPARVRGRARARTRT